MRFARRELGMRGGFLRPTPYNGRTLHDPAYAPFWEEAQDLDFAIGLHEGASGGMAQGGLDRFEARGARHTTSPNIEMILAAMSGIRGPGCDPDPRPLLPLPQSGRPGVPAF